MKKYSKKKALLILKEVIKRQPLVFQIPYQPLADCMIAYFQSNNVKEFEKE